MRTVFLGMVLLWAALLITACAENGSTDAQPIEVVVETALGNIVMEVYVDRAPKTSDYFLNLVDLNEYDGASFYRSGSPLNSALTSAAGGPRLIQGGLLYDFISGTEEKSLTDSGLRMLEEIETTEVTGLKHQYGTVSFARDLWESGYVIPEIFICLGDLPQLDAHGRKKPDDRGFPAFAKVVEGMDVVEKIAGQETGGATRFKAVDRQVLSEPVAILRAYRK